MFVPELSAIVEIAESTWCAITKKVQVGKVSYILPIVCRSVYLAHPLMGSVCVPGRSVALRCALTQLVLVRAINYSLPIWNLRAPVVSSNGLILLRCCLRH